MNNEPIKEVTSPKPLGIFLSSDGTWHEHINYISAKAWIRLNVNDIDFALLCIDVVNELKFEVMFFNNSLWQGTDGFILSD